MFYSAGEEISEVVQTSLPLSKSTERRGYTIFVRSSDDYLGLLTEMIGVPFVLPPYPLKGIGHISDLGMGIDCAELAIYGKRRQGFDIPYQGPRGIIRFLDPIPIDQLFEGCVIHFGVQVSVLYRDFPPTGILNAGDLMIQSFETHVRIVSWEVSGFYQRAFTPYMWEDQLSFTVVRFCKSRKNSSCKLKLPELYLQHTRIKRLNIRIMIRHFDARRNDLAGLQRIDDAIYPKPRRCIVR